MGRPERRLTRKLTGQRCSEADRAQVARAAVDQRRLGAPERVGAEDVHVQPEPAIHSETRRAYCRVVMPCSGERRLVNKKSPGFLPAAFK